MKIQDSVTKALTPIPAPAEKSPFSSRPFAEPAAPEVTAAQPNAPHYSLRTISLAVQPKLTIGQPNDKCEQEADRVAKEVVQRINAPQSSTTRFNNPDPNTTGNGKPKLQLKPIFQRRSAIEGEATPDLESLINRARGGGQSLDPGLQRKMGQAMGADFSRVKVHTDSQSDQLNKSIQARAFTTGQDVFFRQGAYQPGSRNGQELLAHELTHVVQQNGEAVGRSQVLPQNKLQKDQGLERESKAKGVGTRSLFPNVLQTATNLQMSKGEKYVGRGKRRRKQQEEDLLENSKMLEERAKLIGGGEEESEVDRSMNPFAVLSEESETLQQENDGKKEVVEPKNEPTVESETPQQENDGKEEVMKQKKEPTVDELIKEKADAAIISKALKAKYGDTVGAAMSRGYRSRKGGTELELLRYAGVKAEQRSSEEEERGEKPPVGGGGLNQKGKTVSGTKNRGGGEVITAQINFGQARHLLSTSIITTKLKREATSKFTESLTSLEMYSATKT